MSGTLNPAHGLSKILPALVMQGLPHRQRQEGVRNTQSVHGSLKLQPTQHRRLQVILPGQSLRQKMNSHKPPQRHGEPHPQRQLYGIEQIAAQLARHVSDLQRSDVMIPVRPELIKRRRPHLQRHAQGRPEDRELPEQRLQPVLRELPEEGRVHPDERHEERGRGPLVQLRVVGVVVVALDARVVAVDNGEHGVFLLARAVCRGGHEPHGVLEAVGDASREVGVVVASFGQSWMGELAQDGDLAAQ